MYLFLNWITNLLTSELLDLLSVRLTRLAILHQEACPPASQITNVCLATAAILAESPARNRGEQRGADPSLADAKTY